VVGAAAAVGPARRMDAGPGLAGRSTRLDLLGAGADTTSPAVAAAATATGSHSSATGVDPAFGAARPRRSSKR
jgi:hypothetical protein